MYKYRKATKTSIKQNDSYEGETIEQKIVRIMSNKEPISDGAPLVYTDRKDGVLPDYDIRTDRFEIAVDAMDKVTRSEIAKRERRIGERTYDTMSQEEQKKFHEKFPNNRHSAAWKEAQAKAGGQSTQGTI